MITQSGLLAYTDSAEKVYRGALESLASVVVADYRVSGYTDIDPNYVVPKVLAVLAAQAEWYGAIKDAREAWDDAEKV